MLSYESIFLSQGEFKVFEGRNHFWSLFCILIVLKIVDGSREKKI